ncbi:glycosyltransferase family 2 protein [Agathobaculum sp. LCP25S3_E8]|uniref:glycosyltransferase family 2 protein n=1 Tax=Agathobaculum sp. LCP25S3_E8 TaxID=3438735 RepID=UPI003F8EA68C
MLRFLESLQFVLFVFFTAAYAYQIVYLVVGLLGKGRQGKQDAKLHRYAAIIAARNEEGVIGDLIQTLKRQDYPEELLDIFVIADNCTDGTADVSRKAGAIVYERFNKVQVGKGYALDYLFHHIFEDYGEKTYDGFFVFDADNLVDPQFVREMNKMFDTGEYTALTSYRNSKNFCDNWISAGYALWFLREARFLNRPRTQLGVNCAVSGTGFLVAADVIREEGGWPYHLLTEDIEFSIACAARGRKIGYCGTAVIYDEQPIQFRQSWDQRLRWSKGFYQVDAKYTAPLLRGCLRGGRKGVSCYDMLMTVAPCNLVTIGVLGLALFACLSSLSQPAFITYRVLRMLGRIVLSTVKGISFSLFMFGAFTMGTEWKKIKGSVWKKILYVFTFPLFMLTYIPISLVALVGKVEWKPIRHGLTAKAQNENERA